MRASSKACLVPPVQRHDPYKAFNFRVEIEGIARAAFSEVGGLESETAVIDTASVASLAPCASCLG